MRLQVAVRRQLEQRLVAGGRLLADDSAGLAWMLSAGTKVMLIGTSSDVVDSIARREQAHAKELHLEVLTCSKEAGLWLRPKEGADHRIRKAARGWRPGEDSRANRPEEGWRLQGRR